MPFHGYRSYPPPDPSSIHPAVLVNPRPLAPSQEPSFPSPLPQLPSPIRDPNFNSSYTLTTHLYPSAYPHAPSSPFPRALYAEDPGETNESRIARQKALLHELWLKNGARVNNVGRKDPESQILWNVVNRFVRRNLGKAPGREGLTLFLAHPNGLHKESWEPFLKELFSRTEAAGLVIDEVWAYEAVQHGDSALINDNIIGDVFDWADNARDILKFLLYHLPESPAASPLPTHLPRIPEAVSGRRLTAGYTSRSLVGIGHSLGGCAITRVALAYPVLFTSLVLLDPIIHPRWMHPIIPTAPLDPANLAIHRRTKWASRDEALTTFNKSPFFRAWHPEVLQSYVQHGLCPDPSVSKDAVQLKMTSVQETIVFLERGLSYETWELLPQLDTRIELFFILNGKDTRYIGEQALRELPWRRPANATNIIISSAGHLIPQEAPEELATLVVGFLKGEHKRDRLKKEQKSML
ncbi:Alpha/beta hydrolase family-domain-containing protein [Gautieria morchelliformis]|nr:Alpha/beta hydrolase family-domain-containing protein [Gautieria morchelliformis]